MTVDFATYCCEKDVTKLHAAYYNHRASHNYDFDESHLIYQRTDDKGVQMPGKKYKISDSDYDNILSKNGINPNNPEADEYTHGWGAPHYWKHHCVNHLTALELSDADFIVLADADCHMLEPTDWVTKGIQLLKDNPEYLVIHPT